MAQTLTFHYDTLVDAENICDRIEDIKNLSQMIAHDRRVILYAPRRYGKTSLFKNVICRQFEQSSKKNIVLFVNFMGVDSQESVAKRLQSAIEELYAKITPVKSWLEGAAQYFKNLSVTASVDPISAAPTFSIQGSYGQRPVSIPQLFRVIKALAAKFRLLIVLDEFQDIGFSPELVAIFRTEMQDLGHTPVGILGSRRDLLEAMFGRLKSPFFEYGDEYHLKPIVWSVWLSYFNERLSVVGASITEDSIKTLIDLMCDVPNALCEVGAWLRERYPDRVITTEVLIQAMDDLVSHKEQSIRFQISLLSEAEKSVFQAVARHKYVAKMTTKDLLKEVGLSSSATRKIFDRLNHKGFMEWEFEKGYRISSPLVRYFVLRKAL